MLRHQIEIQRSDQAGGSRPVSRNLSPPAVFLMTDSFETGGSERQFAALARSLDSSAFRVSLGCIQKHGAFLDPLAELGEIFQFSLGGSLYGLRSLRARLRLRSHLRKQKIAVAHAFDFYTNLTLIPAARMARVPVVIGSQRQLGDLLTPLQSRLQMAMFRWCDAVICNSQAAANLLLNKGLPRERVFVIGNGLPQSCFAEAEPAIPRRPGVLRVGMIARMNAESKNHRDFLQAAARIVAKLENVEFVLAGDGPLRAGVEREAQELGLGERVVFLGDCRDIPSVLASLDVSVQPSASESLSNVILESMAAGVPVVANRVGGNPELLSEDRGILVVAGDREAMDAAIERLLRDAGLRKQLGQNSRQFAQANFTMERMRKSHEELYMNLLFQKTRK